MKQFLLSVKTVMLVGYITLFISCASAQTTGVSKIVHDQIVRPIGHQINLAFDKADSTVKCTVRYMSVKFIVDSKTLVCDTVIFSKSIAGKFDLDPVVFKNFNINWSAIIETSQCNQASKFEVIQPFSFFNGECFNKYPKLRDDQIWEIYTDLIMLDRRAKANVIILHPAYFSSHK
jgi:hypothetical protein